MIRNKHILVAVLNWGLGHATRSIPIIRDLIDGHNTITIASDGAALALLRRVYPQLPYLALPGYDVRYPTSNMTWNIATQLPKITQTIRAEQLMIQNWLQSHDVDIIISDNRYGCYSTSTENIFISHQLNLQVPFADIINRLHARMVNRYHQIWIVDDENHKLSGALSNPKWINQKIKVKYIGAQSRLSKVRIDKKYDIATILSGPEPQRTLLESELAQKLSETDLNTILIQGSQSVAKLDSNSALEIIPFANADTLSEIICSSELIICRSGYSTIMDLAKLGGKALFVPTPGQTEQVYLAERFEKKMAAQYQEQGAIDIMQAWEDRGRYEGF